MVKDAQRAVVLLSGGMDSCVCAALAARDHQAAAVHVSYGQRTEERERRAFSAICDRLGIRDRLLVRNEALSAIGGSALTDHNIGVPEAQAIGHDVPITYVPFRNAHFLSVAVSWAEVLGASQIYIGAVEQDSSGYPDCRPEFLAAFEKLANLATRRAVEGAPIEVKAPIVRMSKADIVRRGHELGVDFALTVSCYNADAEGRACGQCDSCRFRREGFTGAGLPDPTRYRR